MVLSQLNTYERVIFMAYRRRSNNMYWGTMVLGAFKYLQDAQLGASDYRIFFYLCESMAFRDNIASVKQKMISEDLRMDKSNVSKSIAKLKELQFIVKTRNGFMINPHLFYVRFGERVHLREDFDKLVTGPRRFNMNEDESELEDLRETRVSGIQDQPWLDL